MDPPHLIEDIGKGVAFVDGHVSLRNKRMASGCCESRCVVFHGPSVPRKARGSLPHIFLGDGAAQALGDHVTQLALAIPLAHLHDLGGFGPFDS